MDGAGATPPRRATGARVDSSDNLRSIDAQASACRCVRTWSPAAVGVQRETGEWRCERVAPRALGGALQYSCGHAVGTPEHDVGCSTSHGGANLARGRGWRRQNPKFPERRAQRRDTHELMVC